MKENVGTSASVARRPKRPSRPQDKKILSLFDPFLYVPSSKIYIKTLSTSSLNFEHACLLHVYGSLFLAHHSPNFAVWRPSLPPRPLTCTAWILWNTSLDTCPTIETSRFNSTCSIMSYHCSLYFTIMFYHCFKFYHVLSIPSLPFKFLGASEFPYQKGTAPRRRPCHRHDRSRDRTTVRHGAEPSRLRRDRKRHGKLWNCQVSVEFELNKSDQHNTRIHKITQV